MIGRNSNFDSLIAQLWNYPNDPTVIERFKFQIARPVRDGVRAEWRHTVSNRSAGFVHMESRSAQHGDLTRLPIISL